MKRFVLLSFSLVLFGYFWLWGQVNVYGYFDHRVLSGVGFFPAPAYPILVTVVPWLCLHLALTVLGIWLYLEAFKVKIAWYHFILIIPYVAIEAHGSAASLPPFLIMLAVYLIRKGKTFWGWIAGASYLFRTEMLFLILFRNKWLAISLVTFMAIYIATEGSVFTSNSPAVFYHSLGQLPNNSWHIQYSDSVSNRIAQDSGYAYAWDAPAMFKKMSISALRSDPIEYVRKCAFTFAREFKYGFYSGLDRTILHYPSAIVFGLLFCYCFVWCIFHIKSEDEVVKLTIFTFLFLVVAQALGEQISRHVSAAYLPLIGIISDTPDSTGRI